MPIGAVEPLADRVLLLLRDEGLRHRMGQNGRERMHAFDVHRMVDKYRELYQQALSASGDVKTYKKMRAQACS